MGVFWQSGVMNESARDIRSASFEVTIRPARAVYLVDATPGADRAGVRRAIQEASTRWGGACEPIVLVGGGSTSISRLSSRRPPRTCSAWFSCLYP
ncbi:MAG: hypothetical protein AUG49_01295 [Catenulispora sp. 13_1_20CM_3_70_7]|nr:MAG: hypothetical protein AUG49_01295 [Catenulispora sp. 13_1_20CM_3_70_7]